MRIQNGFGLLSCATPLTLRGAGPPGCHLVLALTAGPAARGDTALSLVHTGRLILLVSEVWFESVDGKTRLTAV